MRLLALSVGNTSLFGGVFTKKKPRALFRIPLHEPKAMETAFSRGAHPKPRSVSFSGLNPRHLRRQTEDYAALFPGVHGPIDRAVVCSVVPALTEQILRAIEAQFHVVPLVLSAASNHALKIDYEKPRTLGSDRVAAALGARQLFPHQHVIVVDCGTATTVTAFHRAGIILGGAILPGLGLWSEMLATRTAQLPIIPLRRPSTPLGRSTQAALTAGIFHGHVGAIRELVARVQKKAFGRAPAVVVGTGGHAPHFAGENLFDVIEPALVLHGLRTFADQQSAV